jgi:hypothetical protein
MALPVISNCFRCAFLWFNAGQGPAVNVMHFSAPGKTDDDVYAQLASTVAPHMWQATSADGRIKQVDIIKLDGSSATRSYTTPVSTEWEGQSTGAIIPQVAALVKLQTGLRGPANRGRVFVPWCGEGSVNAGVIDSTPLGLMVSAWGSFANAMEIGGVALGVASYRHSSWHQATTVVVESVCGTQRRRQNQLR